MIKLFGNSKYKVIKNGLVKHVSQLCPIFLTSTRNWLLHSTLSRFKRVEFRSRLNLATFPVWQENIRAKYSSSAAR